MQLHGTDHHFFHSYAAKGNNGLSGQAQWLPVAVAARDCAPKSPTVSSSHATTRVKQVSGLRGPAHSAGAEVEHNIRVVSQKVVRTRISSRGRFVIVVKSIWPKHSRGIIG